MRPRVLFIITDLLTGGAEKQLARLLARLHGGAIEAAVVSLLSRGAVSAEIETLGIPAWHLGLENPVRLPLALAHVVTIARRFQPEIIQGWMYHGNLAAAWASRGLAGARLMFAVRQSLYDLGREKPLTRLALRGNANASSRAAAIIYNSETARRQHENFGFARNPGLVIDNGFDTALFRPDAAAGKSLRAELGIGADTVLVGLIARYHPMKGHDVFLRAAEQIARSRLDVHFVLIGRGVTADRPPFSDWIGARALKGRLHLLGERADIPRLTAALDIAASASSWGEAFPNAIGEAMSCGVPCVATDVGDVRRILGETGVVVPAGDAQALAAGCERLLALSRTERMALGEAGRQRVMTRFELDAVAKRYATLYTCVSTRKRSPFVCDKTVSVPFNGPRESAE